MTAGARERQAAGRFGVFRLWWIRVNVVPSACYVSPLLQATRSAVPMAVKPLSGGRPAPFRAPCGIQNASGLWSRGLRSLLRAFAWGGALVLAVCVGSAQAGFYTVEVPVDNRQDAERERAVEAGLERVLGRMVGVYDGLEDHPAAALLEEAERYLEGFRYVRVDDQLAVELRYEGPLIRRALGEREVPVWDSYRAPILLWVATEIDGDRQMVNPAVTGPEQDLLERLQRGAEERALPLIFPLLDLTDRRRVGFLDVWGGFEESLEEGSARYGRGGVIAVGLRQAASGAWHGRWSILAGEQSRQFHVGPGPLEAVVEEGLNTAGRLLTERYAAIPGEHDGQQLELVLTGVDGVDHYLGALRHLESVRGVERVDVRRVDGDQLVISLIVERNPERVAEDLDESERLWVEPLPAADVAGGGGQITRTYRWRP